MHDISSMTLEELRNLRDAIDHLLKQYDGSLTNIPAGILPDGPLRNAHSFAWGNTKYDGLTRKGWLLLSALWSIPERALTSQGLAGPVWENPKEIISKGQLHGVRGRINDFFTHHHLPWQLHVREGKDRDCQGHLYIISLEYDGSKVANAVPGGFSEASQTHTTAKQLV